MLHSIAIAAALVATPSSEASQTLSSDDIRQHVESVVVQRLREKGSTARVVSVSGVQDQVLPAGRARHDVGTVIGPWPRSRVGVPVRLSVDGRVVRTLTAWVNLADVKRVLVYGKAAPVKSAAKELHVVEADVDMVCCGGFPATNLEAVRNMRLRRSVRAGEPLLESDFEPKPGVIAGQPVTIVASRGVIHLTTTGTALADGDVGERIQVRPDTTQSVIAAKIVDFDKVMLDE